VDYEQIASPFPDNSVDYILRGDGVIDTFPSINEELSDKAIIDNLNDLVQDSEFYWNNETGYNLRSARAQNERMYLGKQIDMAKLYMYQTPYVENQLFPSIDAIVSYLTANNPSAEVTPGNQKEISRILARNLEKVLEVHCQMVNFKRVFRTAVLHVMLYRIGIIKLYNDDTFGKKGEIVPKAINPRNFVVDKNVRLGENPRWTLEKHKDDLDTLMYLFPNKKKALRDKYNLYNQNRESKMTENLAWNEVHATSYLNGKPVEMVYKYIEDIMLDRHKSEDWIYTDGVENFLPQPAKPYIFINIYNLGDHAIDNTTLIEQGSTLQDVLNKRGRQIMENADTANGVLVMSSEGITTDALENLEGSPNMKIVMDTDGRPIGEFIMQIQPHMLPDYVIEDKEDLRASIRTILATPAQLLGTNQTDAGKDQTATEAIMIKNQATGRLDSIAAKIEESVTEYFKLLVQLMRVHYTEDHTYTYNSGDGDFDNLTISRILIEPDAEVNIATGTTLPFDKAQRQTIALNLAKMGVISPLDLYKDLSMDDPQQRLENLAKWNSDPMSLVEEAKNQQQDDVAIIEYAKILAGEKVEPYKHVNQTHLETHRKQISDADFLRNGKPKHIKVLADLLEGEIKIFNLNQAADALTAPEPISLGGPNSMTGEMGGATPVPPQQPPQPPMPQGPTPGNILDSLLPPPPAPPQGQAPMQLPMQAPMPQPTTNMPAQMPTQAAVPPTMPNDNIVQ